MRVPQLFPSVAYIHRPLRAHVSLRKLSGPGRLMPTYSINLGKPKLSPAKLSTKVTEAGRVAGACQGHPEAAQ